MNFNKPRKVVWIPAGILILSLIAVLDYWSGRELSLALFYLIPIAFFTWIFGKRAGIVTAFSSSMLGMIINILTGITYSNNLIHFWNALIRFGLFLLPVLLLHTLEQEKKQSRTDFLTGVFNHRYFNELLQREVERSKRYRRPFTVAFLDTDNFKTINDTFGHLFGDTALQAIANGIKKNLRKTDFVARVGGDEFAILLPETDEAAAHIAISHMKKKALDELNAKKFPVTFSIGVLTLFAPELSADEILGMTDEIMYLVKNNGKDNIRHQTYVDEKTSAPTPPQS
jgi:diguanylate cyclase (GGDEF)-like protein